jgi:hypothetical protein
MLYRMGRGLLSWYTAKTKKITKIAEPRVVWPRLTQGALSIDNTRISVDVCYTN